MHAHLVYVLNHLLRLVARNANHSVFSGDNS